MSERNQGYLVYADLAGRYAELARSLPSQVNITPTRTVVCFEVLGCGIAVFIEELSEILEVPHCTRLPRVKPWVRGVANVRGKLVPVIDFPGFLGQALRGTPKQQRTVLLESADMAVGLIVDQVVGMKHFPIDTFTQSGGAVPRAIAPYVPGAFRVDGRDWLLLRPEQLFGDHQFMDVAA